MQRSFAMGEIAPTLYGGANQEQYQAGLALARNFVILRGGGAGERTGSQYVATVKDSSKQTYLYKFVFNDTDTFLLELGDLYMRFHRNGAPVVVAPAAWSALTTYVVGDLVVSGGVNYYCVAGHINHVPPNATYWYALTGNILEIPTPWVTADIPLLKFVQSQDTVTFTHHLYAPRQLQRASTGWALTTFGTGPWAAAPTNVVATRGAAGALNPVYVVTAAKANTYEETDGSTPATCANSATPTAAAPNVITWDAVAGAAIYYVFVDTTGNGTFGFIGMTPNLTFNDVGFTPDQSVQPPVGRVLFNSTGNYPNCSTYYQQRQVFAGSDNNPEQASASRTGAFKNFDISNPLQDDDAITFGAAGRQTNAIRHMIDIGTLAVMTRTGEFSVEGDTDGVLRPTSINLKQRSYWGASDVIPQVMGKSILYVQARGTIVRDFRFNEATATSLGYYDGRDLTIYAQHLFKGVSISRMDLALTPDPILWCVRSDGILLGLTYLPELPNLWAWHHHDAGGDGVYEDVCIVPETLPATPGALFAPTSEDAVYVVVRRTINGNTQRTIERFSTRNWSDLRVDAIYLDCDMDYNGINAGAATVTLLPNPVIVDVIASAPTFDITWVGDGVTVWGDTAGDVVRILITTFASSTHLQGTVVAAFPVGTRVPSGLQNNPVTTWSRAVHSLGGLTPLASQSVSILANGIALTGIVDASGNLANIDGQGGLYDVVHVGLPITAELETLDLDGDNDVRDKRKLVKNVSVLVEQSRSFEAGPDINNLTLYPGEDGVVLSTDIFNDPDSAQLLTQITETDITCTWDKPGRVHIRNKLPYPLNVLGIILNGPVGG
jgi:hypothetical protein